MSNQLNIIAPETSTPSLVRASTLACGWCFNNYKIMFHYKNLSLTDIEGEVWKQVEFSKYFYVSSKGRIRISERKLSLGNGNFRTQKAYIKAQHPNKNTGYLMVHLVSKEESYNKRWNTHRLSAETFYGKPKTKLVVNHKNGVKLDICIESLEFVTSSYNNTDALVKGLRNVAYTNISTKLLRGSKSPNARKVKRTNIITGESKIFGCILDAAIDTYGRIYTGSINKCLKGKRENVKGLKWEHYE